MLEDNERARPDDDGKPFRVLSCAEGLGIAEVGSVCMVLWREQVTIPKFRRQQLMLEDTVARYPGRAGFLCVIEATSTAPDDYFRKASAEMVARCGQRLRCIACVIEGTGFRAAVNRSVLSGMALLLSSKATEIKFTPTVAAAAPWIARNCEGVSALSLLQAHEQLRCVACVIEGTGFRAAVNRSVLSGMALLLSSKATEIKFTPTVAAAAPWIARNCEGVSALSLLQAHEQLRMRLESLRVESAALR